jgi:hypothetical protein
MTWSSEHELKEIYMDGRLYTWINEREVLKSEDVKN